MSYENIINEKKLKIWVDLSTFCNASCPQCHRTNPNGLGKADWLPLVQWSISQFKQAFPKISFVKEFEFCGSWGDPAMNKDIIPICKYIMKYSKANILIKTNGSMRESDFWWDLGVLCGDRLNVEFAVDGTTQSMHEKYRQKTELKKVLEHLEIVSQTYANTSVITIIFKHNENKIYDISKMVYKLGAKQITFVPSNRFYNVQINNFNKFFYKKNNEKTQTLIKSKYNWDWKVFRLHEKSLEEIKYEQNFKN